MENRRRVTEKVTTTPQLVEESNRALFRARINIPKAAQHCGMTEREMKMTFREFLKSHPPDYATEVQGILPL